jgi:alanine racemase
MKILLKRQYGHLNTIFLSKRALSNYRSVQACHPEARICPVIKSNAYGHGLSPISTLVDTLQSPFLCVDSLYEAYEVQKLHVRTPIFIMGYTKPENFIVKKLPFSIAVFDSDTLDALSAYQHECPIHIKLDTGMSRYGVRIEDLRSFVRYAKMKKLRIDGLFSHFADADNKNSMTMTNRQIQVYKEGVSLLAQEGVMPRWRHISASAGSFKVFDTTFTMIRLGIALYGINPLDPEDPSYDRIILKPVLSFCSTITQIKKLMKGDTVGYNAIFTAKKTMKIAIIPAGYFEGIDRRLSNIGYVMVNQTACPIIGRVSMNISAIDITKAGKVTVGDTCFVYSDNRDSIASIPYQAKKAKTIPYELLVHLNASIYREITE